MRWGWQLLITYENIPLDTKELSELRKYEIEYVFQPIFSQIAGLYMHMKH